MDALIGPLFLSLGGAISIAVPKLHLDVRALLEWALWMMLCGVPIYLAIQFLIGLK